VTGSFGPIQIALEGVDPDSLGKGISDLSAQLDANGQIHAVYRAWGGTASCEGYPDYDPTDRHFYATGSPVGAWQSTLLEERDQEDLHISNLVRDGGGTLHVASANGDDPENIHLFSISGGNASEQSIDIDFPPAFGLLRAAPRAGAQEPMLLVNSGSEWMVREPPAP
jgi:hypothetical protein